MKKITLGYSPCPNDTFMFYALSHGIFKDNIEFKEIIEDIETLNKMAIKNMLDITKASYHVYGFIKDDYCILNSGSAIGKGCGPILVSKNKIKIDELKNKKIAIPGSFTTATLLLKLFAPDIKYIIEMPFDRIMNSVSLGVVDAGLIIHEGRFTYKNYGLLEIIDLGEWWEKETNLPIPLGGIFAKKELGKETLIKIDSLIKKSIEFALKNPELAKNYIKKYSQEIDDEVIEQHISLYVNDYTLNIRDDGLKAVEKLLSMAKEFNIIP